MDEWLELSDLTDRVQELLEMGLYEEVLGLLDRYIAFYQDEWEIYFLYSRLYLEQNEPRRAIPYLHKSLKIDKKNLDVLLGLFYSYAEMDQFKKASKYLARASKYYPEYESVMSAMIWYHTETNNFDKAISFFEKALKIGTDNPDTFRNAGIAYERIGNFENAEQCFKTALQLYPHFDEVRDLLADHYIFLGDPKKSISLYQEYLKESPKNIRTLSRLVFCLSQNDQFEDALALAQETIRLYPNSPVGYVDCAYVYLNSGRTDLALVSADKALDVSPIDAEALRVKGIAFSEKNRPREAEKAFEAALSIEPENAEIMRDYYHHLRTVNKHAKMEKLVTQVIKMERPYCIEDYWFLADYHREKGENLKAFHFLHKAYKSMPGEKELIPPMVDIMLDTGHVLYSLPFLLRYAEKNGWNDVMSQIVRHKRMRERCTGEGIRFLRFYSQKPAEFRKYIFLVYFEKFLIVSLALVAPALCLVLYFLSGISGILYCAGFSLLLFGGWKSAKFLINRKCPETRS
jgi:tetratricopeptide (TPR) repeat protein